MRRFPKFAAFIENFLSGLSANLIGGIVLAVLFFFAREQLFPLPDITGKWNFTLYVHETSYEPYKDMVISYVAILLREGNNIEGTSEKIYQKSTKDEITYTGTKRTRGFIKGYIEKNYFEQSRLTLHITEEGKERESTIYQKLVINNESAMEGKFYWTAADKSGDVEWKRDSKPNRKVEMENNRNPGSIRRSDLLSN